MICSEFSAVTNVNDSYTVTDSSSVIVSMEYWLYRRSYAAIDVSLDIPSAFIPTFIYPAGTSSTLSLGGQFAKEILTDERDDSATIRPVGLIAEIQTNDPDGHLEGANMKFSDGTSGFWGKGVYQVNTTISSFT